jgi:hypothetical protein
MTLETQIAELEAAGFNVNLRNEGTSDEGYVVWAPTGRPYTNPHPSIQRAWEAAINNRENGVSPTNARLEALRQAEAERPAPAEIDVEEARRAHASYIPNPGEAA